ncbi:conserved hypothetical protein [Alteracholeplasma palmae J233]|uniref:Uncharacterized protein n=1 Tax=Alteracholeplasma palmae (strain ATCC 49389 / J233) TaxID=1318466 RepID=U4KJQ6_ALTPJ|nr:hypothetical protein [Alteracholeplasma palmae]CCV63648.1 conserved hypothetical protein [Alteracholeplasma palmae J233]
MDNLVFDLVWEDETLLEVCVTAITDRIKISQNIYMNQEIIKQLSESINHFINDISKKEYFESGPKVGNYTPAFSIEIKNIGKNSLVCMEVDMEIADNPERIHRCKFYLYTELGLLERFSKRILSLQLNRSVGLLDY